MCQTFQLGEKGHPLLCRIIEELPERSTVLGNIVHVGFGVDSFVQRLSNVYEGGVLVAVAASLTECYKDDHAASILWEMTQVYMRSTNSQGSLPSPSQWKDLLKQMAGVLSKDEFPKIAEFFMQFHPNNRLDLAQAEVLQISAKRRSIARPREVAEALLAISQVSNGKLDSVTVRGSADGGWLAAFAHRFLDLRVLICIRDKDPYLTYDPSERFQLKIIYDDSSNEASAELDLAERVYHLHDATDILHGHDSNAFGCSLISGRVAWGNALRSTFGQEFDWLLEHHINVGGAIGSAARIIEAVSKAKNDVDRDITYAHQTYMPSGYGRELIDFATARFPELAPIKNHMESALKRSFNHAIAKFEEHVKSLKNNCKCSGCERGKSSSSNGSNLSSSQSSEEQEDFCLVVLVQAIICLIRSLAGIDSADLLPTRAGLESFFKAQQAMRLSYQTRPEIVPQKVSDAFGHAAWLLEDVEQRAFPSGNSRAEILRLNHAIVIFAGREADKIGSATSAACVSGICVFLSTLELKDFSGRAEDMGRCRVMTGGIELSGRRYDFVQDMNDFDLVGKDYMSWGGAAPAAQLYSPNELVDGYQEMYLKAQPAIDSLSLGLSIKHKDGRSIVVGPAKITAAILQGSGFARCKHDDRQRFSPNSDTTVWSVREDEPGPVWAFQGNLLSRLAAIAKAPELEHRIVWRSRECLDCCVQGASTDYPSLILSSREAA